MIGGLSVTGITPRKKDDGMWIRVKGDWMKDWWVNG